MIKETFDFSEALRRMRQWKKVKRHGWETVDSLWINGDGDVSIRYKASNSESFIHITPKFWCFFTLCDILATDWEEVEG